MFHHKHTDLLIITHPSYTQQFASQDENYHYYVDLNKTHDRELDVTLITPKNEKNVVLYRFPKIVPGTYSIYDYGRFVSGFKAYDADGKSLKTEMADSNSWKINDAQNLEKITYTVHDSWHPFNRYNFIFQPAGTNFQKDSNFVMNGFALYGYIEGITSREFEINVTKPESFYGSTALIPKHLSSTMDRFTTKNYFELTDSPIMYDKPDTVILHIGGADVLVSVYSVTGTVTAQFIASNIYKTLNGQKDYLGGTLPMKKYAFIMYFFQPGGRGFRGFGALEHNLSSMYYTPEMDTAQLKTTMDNFTTHEFFHVITPLSIHSEEIGNFDFNNPKMSEHLWLYEGVTEYSAGIMQVKEGLISREKYLEMVREKINGASRFNDTLAFTEMSKHVLDKYESQYTNVYQKGALIGMCLDIKLRDLSDGKYGIRDLLKDLSKKYGRNNSFKDDELFGEITSLTSPAIGEFLNTYVAGDKHLPIKDVLDLAGVNFYPTKEGMGYSMGGIEVDASDSGVFITDTSKEDDFGKMMGYRDGDKILKINGREINGRFFRFISQFYDNLTEPRELSIDVERKDNNGEMKTETLKQTMIKVDKMLRNVVEFNPDATERQIKIRDSWLGENK
ncbi:MAG: peptidase M61 [Ignavibacteria bacterium]